MINDNKDLDRAASIDIRYSNPLLHRLNLTLFLNKGSKTSMLQIETIPLYDVPDTLSYCQSILFASSKPYVVIEKVKKGIIIYQMPIKVKCFIQ